MINEVNKRFLKFSFNGENRSIDESMILYYETHSSSQRINNKPIRVGHNIWFFAETYGYVVQLEPHQCVKKGKQAVSSFKWGLGEKDVLRLIECLSLMLGIIYLWITISQLFILVYFTTLELATFATGEVNKNELLRHLEQCISSKKSSATLTVVGWNSKALQSFT